MAKAARPINESNRSLSQYLEEIGQFEPYTLREKLSLLRQ